ncbi:MAG: phosphorylase [Gammaproteobacteria bacterium]|jgi:adenosylhomocysteine nucleosidase|nr:phosphorylase [Gammaproteobacteria bacterium]
MPIGIIAALSAEARSLSARPINLNQLTELEHGDLLWQCGMGAERARQAARSLLDAGATALLSWGTAGGLDPALRPGDVVLPVTVVPSAGVGLAVDAAWHMRLCRCLAGYNINTGLLIQSPRVMAEPADKAELFQNTGAVAVDMESAAIAQVCNDSNKPFMVVRAIADPAGRSIPAAVVKAMDVNGRVSLSALGLAAIGRPQLLTALLQLHKDSRAAYATLSRIARLTGTGMAR